MDKGVLTVSSPRGALIEWGDMMRTLFGVVERAGIFGRGRFNADFRGVRVTKGTCKGVVLLMDGEASITDGRKGVLDIRDDVFLTDGRKGVLDIRDDVFLTDGRKGDLDIRDGFLTDGRKGDLDIRDGFLTDGRKGVLDIRDGFLTDGRKGVLDICEGVFLTDGRKGVLDIRDGFLTDGRKGVLDIREGVFLTVLDVREGEGVFFLTEGVLRDREREYGDGIFALDSPLMTLAIRPFNLIQRPVKGFTILDLEHDFLGVFFDVHLHVDVLLLLHFFTQRWVYGFRICFGLQDFMFFLYYYILNLFQPNDEPM